MTTLLTKTSIGVDQKKVANWTLHYTHNLSFFLYVSRRTHFLVPNLGFISAPRSFFFFFFLVVFLLLYQRGCVAGFVPAGWSQDCVCCVRLCVIMSGIITIRCKACFFGRFFFLVSFIPERAVPALIRRLAEQEGRVPPIAI